MVQIHSQGFYFIAYSELPLVISQKTIKIKRVLKSTCYICREQNIPLTVVRKVVWAALICFKHGKWQRERFTGAFFSYQKSLMIECNLLTKWWFVIISSNCRPNGEKENIRNHYRHRQRRKTQVILILNDLFNFMLKAFSYLPLLLHETYLCEGKTMPC